MRRQATETRCPGGPATIAAAPPIKARHDSPCRAWCDDDPEPGATGHPLRPMPNTSMVTPQAEVDPNKKPNTTSVAGTESGKSAHPPHATAEHRGRAVRRPVPRCAGHRGGPAAQAVGDPRPRQRAAYRQFRCISDGQRYDQRWLPVRRAGAVIKSSSRRWLHSSPGYPGSPAVGRAVCIYIASLGVNVLNCRDEVRRDHRVSGRQGPAMRTRLPTMPHDTASRTLARLRIGPDADHGAWSSRRGHPHT